MVVETLKQIQDKCRSDERTSIHNDGCWREDSPQGGHALRVVGAVDRDGTLSARLASESLVADAQLRHSHFKVAMTSTGSSTAVATAESGSQIAVAALAPVPGHVDTRALALSLLSAHYSSVSDSTVESPGQQLSTAVWDNDKGQLLLYRDRVGAPPWFYWQTAQTFAFATTMAALLELGAPAEVDEVALGHYQLIGYIQAPRTMVRSIRKVPAGHRLELTRNGLQVSRFWVPEWEPKFEVNPSEVADDLESIMAESIERVIPESGRLGILLSSGIDSVGLAAVAAKETDAAVSAFTFDYADYEGRFNEGGEARRVSDLLGIDHEVIEVTPQMVIKDYGKLTRSYEEPISYGIHSAWMKPIRDAGIEVAITGAVGGYWATNRALDWAIRIGHRAPQSILKRAAQAIKKLPTFAHDLKTVLGLAAMSDPERYLADSQQVVLSATGGRALRTEPGKVDLAQADLIASLELALAGMETLSSADRLALLGLSSFGAEHLVWWSYRWAETAGVSLRFPLMDREFVDFMGRLKHRDKDSPERRIIAAKYLPHEIAYKKKTPQTIPIDHWLRGPLLDWTREILTKDEIEADGRLDFDQIQRCITAHASGDASHKWCIWTSLSYLIWKREFLGMF